MKSNLSMAKTTALFMLIVLMASFMSAITFSAQSNVGSSDVPSLKASSHLMINEFISTAVNESVELYNPTTSDINLSTWIFSDRPLFSAEWPGGETNGSLRDCGNITAGGYKVIGIGQLFFGMALSDESDDLYLYDNSTGQIVNASTARDHLVDEVAWGKLGGAPDPPRNNSTARAPNGEDTDRDAFDWTIDLTPTMNSTHGWANDAPPADLCKGPIVINEVLAHNASVPDFIELYNNATIGGPTINISGWWISDGEGIYVIPSGTLIPADNFWFVNATKWAVSGLGLDDYSDNVYLFNSTGHRMDQMGWSSDHGRGTSVARFNDGVGKCYAYNDTTLVDCGWAEERAEDGSPKSRNNCTHIWVTLHTKPWMVRMFLSNYTLVNATIANMINATTQNVNVTLTLPEPNVTITNPLINKTEVPLGNLTAYEKRVVVWNLTVKATGYHYINLSVAAEFEPNPRNVTTSVFALLRVDIVFDDSHDIYYDWDRMPTFRGFLEQMGYVYLNPRDSPITDELLDGVKLLVLPAIQSDYIANEAEVIKNFIDNGGSVLILGYAYWSGGTFKTWEIQNNITSAYGINFTATHIYDNNDNTGYSHWTVCKTWADNPIANKLTYNVQKVSTSRACTLKIDETKGVKPIGTGDTDLPLTNRPLAKNLTGYVVAEGTDVIVHAAVETPGGGRIFATGSATIFCDADFYLQYEDGEQFARNVIGWLMRPVTNIEVECSLQSLYNVSIKGNLTVNYGHNITVAFYSYDNEYQANTTINWTVTTSPNVTLSANLTHPLGLPVEKIMLVLTDEEGNTWGGFKICVISRSHLSGRMSQIDLTWPTASAPERQELFKELVAIDFQWPYAPP